MHALVTGDEADAVLHEGEWTLLYMFLKADFLLLQL